MLAVLGNVLASPFMNILIEDADTLEYLGGNGQWTKDISQSRRFAGTQAALLAAKKEPIGKFNIVSYVTETHQLVNLNHGKGKGAEAVVG